MMVVCNLMEIRQFICMIDLFMMIEINDWFIYESNTSP